MVNYACCAARLIASCGVFRNVKQIAFPDEVKTPKCRERTFI
jgi:hypothetical protein